MRRPLGEEARRHAVLAWRCLVLQLHLLPQASLQTKIKQLVEAKTTSSSSSSARRNHLPEPKDEQIDSPHPRKSWISRGNQWGTWKVCGVCRLRVQYSQSEFAKQQALKYEKVKEEVRTSFKQEVEREARARLRREPPPPPTELQWQAAQ